MCGNWGSMNEWRRKWFDLKWPKDYNVYVHYKLTSQVPLADGRIQLVIEWNIGFEDVYCKDIKLQRDEFDGIELYLLTNVFHYLIIFFPAIPLHLLYLLLLLNCDCPVMTNNTQLLFALKASFQTSLIPSSIHYLIPPYTTTSSPCLLHPSPSNLSLVVVNMNSYILEGLYFLVLKHHKSVYSF